MTSKTHSAQLTGLKPNIVDIEVDIVKGMHCFSVIGLADKSVEESRDRIGAAIKNSGFIPPYKGNKKIVVSLAPADIKKEGPAFDLGIALGLLLASEEIKFNAKKKLFLGELSLSGELRGIKGALLIAEHSKKMGFEEIYLPEQNAKEAALVRGIKIYPCKTLKDVIAHLNEKENEKLKKINIETQPETEIEKTESKTQIDFSEIKGQETAKRGLEIAAAGGHNIILFGPPGTGKTMLAKAFSSILPSLAFEEALEVTGIHSASGFLDSQIITDPPFRSPHHTSSYISLVGGGANPKPGEITLAHRGVLFLDEFPEFETRVIESLRQPLEDRVVTISRAKGTMKFPASFTLVAAMNLCPCGNKGLKGKECVCNMNAINRYQRKISGPIADRIDLWLSVPQIEHRKLAGNTNDGAENSNVIKERVEKARGLQAKRFENAGQKTKINSEMSSRETKKHAPLSEKCQELLISSAERLDLSARVYNKLIKVARTIADLDNAENIEEKHILEALQYRPKEI